MRRLGQNMYRNLTSLRAITEPTRRLNDAMTLADISGDSNVSCRPFSWDSPSTLS